MSTEERQRDTDFQHETASFSASAGVHQAVVLRLKCVNNLMLDNLERFMVSRGCVLKSSDCLVNRYQSEFSTCYTGYQSDIVSIQLVSDVSGQ